MASALLLNYVVTRNTPTTTASLAAAATTTSVVAASTPWQGNRKQRWGLIGFPHRNRLAWRTTVSGPPSAGNTADDSSPPFDMSVESALKLLGVQEGASFDDILRAKKLILAACKGDEEMVAKAEAAYEMLLMQSLAQRRAGKVLSSSVRYADVKPFRPAASSSMPLWLQSTVKKIPLSVESPSSSSLGVEAGVFGALMALTYVSGTSTVSAGSNSGADVPGLILATGFGVSLYFLAKKKVNLGKAALITTGGLVAGAVIGSAVQNWLQVDIVPFLGIRSPAVVVSEFVLVCQLLVSLYLR